MLRNIAAGMQWDNPSIIPELLQAWDRMHFRCEYIRSNEQIKWWNTNVFQANLDARFEGIGRSIPYIGSLSSEWKLQTPGECELYMCWLEYEGSPCIGVPVYIHQDVAFAQGIRRFHALEGHVPQAAGRLGAHLLAEVCEYFRREPSYRLRFLFVYPFNPFATQVRNTLIENGIRFCLHGHTLLETDYPSDSSWVQNSFWEYSFVKLNMQPHTPNVSDSEAEAEAHEEGDIRMIDEEEQPYVNMNKKDLGVMQREIRSPRWDVLNQRWETPREIMQTEPNFRPFREGWAPYNFLMSMSGGSIGIFIIDADSMAERLAYATLAHQETSDTSPFHRNPDDYDTTRGLNAHIKRILNREFNARRR